jgi:hypothetical protein
MLRAFVTAVAAASLLAVKLGAQSAIFLDRNYAVRMVPDLGLMYEVQPAIPLYLYSKLDDLYGSLRDPAGGWSTAKMVVLTPMFRIRQLTDKAASSAPVRTPSFMPKLTAQLLASHRLGDPDQRAGFPFSSVLIGVGGTFGHYSNGQAGCFRSNQRHKNGDDGDCELDPAAPAGSDSLNTADGSFSTWYFRAQTHIRFAHYKDPHPSVSVTLNAGIDWHPEFLEPIGGMDTALATVYGRWRPFGGIEVARRSVWDCPKLFIVRWLPCGAGRVRASVNAEYIPTRPSRIAPVASTSELAWTFTRYAGFGPIVRLHLGQDYYNIALGHELNVLQYGFTFDLERDDPIPERRTSSRP